MNGTNFSLLISAGASILTIFGVQVVNALAKRNESQSRIQGKEFDDGIERRKELIKEIENDRITIAEKDRLITIAQARIESLKDEITRLTIDYVKLEGRYNDAVEDLAKFSEELAKKFKDKANATSISTIS